MGAAQGDAHGRRAIDGRLAPAFVILNGLRSGRVEGRNTAFEPLTTMG
jgi:hypothetical protein